MKSSQERNLIRLEHLVRILNSLNKLSLRFSRNYYVELLKKEIEINFSFHRELVSEIISLFPLSEIILYFINSTTSRPLTIRHNTLRTELDKTKNFLRNQGIKYLKIKEITTEGLLIKSTPIRLTKSVGFLAGLFTIQGVSSMMVISSLQPKTNDRILDLASSPGGKTTQISQFMKNKGLVIANDIEKSRIGSLLSNIHRLSVENTIVSNYDGVLFRHVMRGFDKVLVDAPCSGTGLIGHDQEIKKKSLKRQIIFNCEIQKKLLISAIDSCKGNLGNNNCIVYSTCSILVQENESVIQHALERRNVKIVPTGLSIGMPGFTRYHNKFFDSSMVNCRRFYPHIHNLDGFFICKLIKL